MLGPKIGTIDCGWDWWGNFRYGGQYALCTAVTIRKSGDFQGEMRKFLTKNAQFCNNF